MEVEQFELPQSFQSTLTTWPSTISSTPLQRGGVIRVRTVLSFRLWVKQMRAVAGSRTRNDARALPSRRSAWAKAHRSYNRRCGGFVGRVAPRGP